jgi:hypothetical protein
MSQGRFLCEHHFFLQVEGGRNSKKRLEGQFLSTGFLFLEEEAKLLSNTAGVVRESPGSAVLFVL